MTHSKIAPILFAVLSLSALSVKAQDAPKSSHTQIKKRLEAAVQKAGFKAGELGLWVGLNQDGAPKAIFAQNPQTPFLPASLSKLVTAGAVLSDLHPGHKFKTQLAYSSKNAKLEGGVLNGPIYLKGGGDPAFISEKMWFLVNELTRSAIKRVDGDVIVDDSLFDAVRFGEDRQDERVDRAYDAPVGAMSMNWNSVNVYFRPGLKVGDPLQVNPDVMTPYFKLKNETRTAAAGRGKTVTIERTSEKGFAGDILIARGAMAIDSPEAVIYKSISKPDIWSGFNLIEFLRQRGIEVRGTVRSGTLPADAVILATAESEPLSRIVADMSKWSNNYVAEMLVKNLAAANGDVPATMEKGMIRVRSYLERKGFKAADYEFINAAGFTRKNRLSPEQLGRLLEIVRSDFAIFPEYLTSLPIAGIDGTLRSRMKDSAATKWVRAKTGLLNGAVGLAGYAGRADGQIISFAFIYNGPAREDKARALFDRMAAMIVED
ncbi:MAG: D-alanyl-D-alanine carboxypeptidase/D-alanyl-D-alanine-endopeptidase [Bdellovibrionota bacterium]